ncbi:MAG: sedoheptulose 7-phosphate cyclase [Nakamurella sp.]
MRASDGTGYRVDITDGALDARNALLADVIDHRRVQVFTGPTVHRLYGNRLRDYLGRHLEPGSWQVHEIPTGETAKTFTTVELVCALAKSGGLDRRGVMMAMGGGVTADIVGFAASVFGRGVDHIRLTTTLLSQVDVGVGVKTGVNALGSKNMLGSYHPALGSISDLDLLTTLPVREIRCGMAEIVKMAVILGADLFTALEMQPRLFEGSDAAHPRTAASRNEVTRRAMRLMLDELHTNLRERDLARLVDFGHTFSPVIEMASGHRIAHGESVAIDMALSARIAAVLGQLSNDDADRIVALLTAIGLPVDDFPTCTPRLLTSAMDAARARRGQRLNLVLPTAIGAATFVDDVPPGVLDEALLQMRRRPAGRPLGLVR